MEIYAAMVDHLDYNIGRLLQYLKDTGEYEYTFIMFHLTPARRAGPSTGRGSHGERRELRG